MIHLHTHSNFSVGDALPSPSKYAEAIGEGGVLALTDHDSLAGMIYHNDACKKHGVKAIQGVDLKTEHGNLTLLCEDYSGLRNLFKLIALGNPPTYDDLNNHSKGLIALSGDLSGEFSTRILRGDKPGLKSYLKRMRDIFPNSFYLEKINHGLMEQKKVCNAIDWICERSSFQSVTTNDVHYLSPEYAAAQAVLMLDRFKKKRDFRSLMWHIHKEAWLKPLPEEATAKEIAERCNVTIKTVPPRLPKFPFPKEFSSEEDFFKSLSFEGLKNRGMERFRERLDFEIQVICSMGFAGYFLWCWDFVKWARDNGIPVGPGRGSGAGSLAAYSLKITNIDPMEYDLLFERFLNPSRVSMPDFDIDFGPYGRDKVIDYVVRKSGIENSCQIMTYSELKPRAAWKAAASALFVKTKDADAFSKLLPGQDNSLEKTSLKDIFDEDGKVMSSAPSEYQKISNYLTKKRSDVIKIARRLEGAYKSEGKHAAGLIITRGPVVENIPASINREEGALTKYISQLDKTVVEKMGAIKFDFLGLAELDVIAYTVKAINRKEFLDIDQIPLNDEKVFCMISEGRTRGVFQLGSEGLSSYCMFLKPETFMDIVATTSLYRPGPKDMGMHEEYARRKNGLSEVTYLHEDLKSVLGETYGIIVYQEQVIAIPQLLSGYSLAEADLLRRAVGKKDLEKMKKHEEKFIKGGISNGYSEEMMLELWNQINAFARYGFNKSHAVAYSMISYQGAWLKANYPAEFLAAQIQVRDMDEVTSFVREAINEFGIKVNEPEVGKTTVKTREQNGEIWLGYQIIKGLGERCRKMIENRFFQDIYSFCLSVKPTKSDFEALTFCGALDKFLPEHPPEKARAILINSWDVLKNVKQTSQVEMFSTVETYSIDLNAEPLTLDEMLQREYFHLGRYRTGHPSLLFEERSNFIGATKIKDIKVPNRYYTICGVITSFNEIKTKKGDPMCFITVEDDTESISITVFPKDYTIRELFCFEDQPSDVRYITIRSNFRNERMEGIFDAMERA